MKILCLPYTHTLSHISRPLAVALELRKRGHEIIFAGESSKTKFIQQEKFAVEPLYEPDPDVLYGNIRSGKLKFVSEDEIQRLIEADLRLYKDVKPDLVLSDGRFSAPLSTHLAQLRHAAIVNVSSTEYRALPYIPFFDWVPAGMFDRNSKVWKVLDAINLRLEMLVFDNTMSIFKKLSRKYGLRSSVTATNCLAGKDMTLLADIPEYFPTINLPDNYFYIGPLTWKSSIAKPSWWPPPALDSGPLTYITMGTTGIGDFFTIIYEMIKKSELAAILTTGTQCAGLESIPGKIYVEDYLDGDLAVAASDIVICHGGNGTIYQALQHGRPIIGIPTIPDQEFNMRRVESLGVGRKLSWKEFASNPDNLLNAIRAVLNNPEYTRKAFHMQEILNRYEPRITAADMIERHFTD